jgi:chromosome segregation ATPase
MSEEWPYEPKDEQYIKNLESDVEKLKTQLYDTLLNSNRVVGEIQKLQNQLNACQIENSKLKSQIESLKKSFEK